MGKISVDVNNGMVLSLVQDEHDGDIRIERTKDGAFVDPWDDVITPSDFVMLLNYYRFQKAEGKEIF